MMTLPTIRATQLDKPRITGGGYTDNMPIDHLDVTPDGHIIDTGATHDATELWAWVTAYTTAVAEWLNVPALPLPAAPDADPLTARALALTATGWLADHAQAIQPVHELDQHREAMFALIRRLRSRYGVTDQPRRPRRPRADCTVCGTRSVIVTWADNPNGGPKPIRIAKCQKCHQTYTERKDTD